MVTEICHNLYRESLCTMACSKMSVEQQILMDNCNLSSTTYLDADNIIDQLIKANLISQRSAWKK